MARVEFEATPITTPSCGAPSVSSTAHATAAPLPSTAAHTVTKWWSASRQRLMGTLEVAAVGGGTSFTAPPSQLEVAAAAAAAAARLPSASSDTLAAAAARQPIASSIKATRKGGAACVLASSAMHSAAATSLHAGDTRTVHRCAAPGTRTAAAPSAASEAPIALVPRARR